MPEDRKTVWTCQVAPDRIVRLEDIPIEDWTPLEKELEESWLTLIAAPLRSSTTTLAVYHLACRFAGVEPESGMAAGKVLSLFELVEDDRPLQWVNGLPDPKAEDLTTAG